MSQVVRHSSDIEKWLLLRHIKGVGPVAMSRLLDFFGSVDQILGAEVSRLGKVQDIGPKTARAIASGDCKINIEKELALAEKLRVQILHLDDDRYPPVLRRIYDPPAVLYVRGQIVRRDNLAIAIVGSRRCSHYGFEQASRLGHLLAASGFTIVSGMARGIDTAAHCGALSAQGRTIAVQGCGLSRVFPPENRELFGHIINSGACVSELPLQAEPLAGHFPGRNRIIAGLSLGSIIVEAGLRSGAMITASAATSYDREVMAVPGPISNVSKGPHQLIKDGARLVETVEDVLEAVGAIVEQLKSHAELAEKEARHQVEKPLFDIEQHRLSGDEKKILEALANGETHIDEIIETTALAPGTVNSTLISLRLKGLITQLAGNMFTRRG